MEKLLEYLKKQRDERVKKLDAYNEAFAEFEAARNRVDAFGDMGGIEGEIGELDTYIDDVEKKIAAEAKGEPVGDGATTDGNEYINEVVVNCKA